MISLRRRGIVLLICISVGYLPAAAQTSDRGRGDTAVTDTVVVGSEEGTTAVPQSDSMYDTAADTAGLGGDSLTARTVPDSMVRAWKNDPDFAYANDPRYWQREREEESPWQVWLLRFLSSAAFRYGVYIILGALLVYAIGRIVTENNLGGFYRRGKKRPGGKEEQPAEETLTEEDLDRRLQHALDSGDYRSAIRYSYLRSLMRLDERGLIRYHGRATNHEYLRQLAGTAQEAPFRFLTLAYEKVWYGQFGLNEETFRRLSGYFMEFDKTLRG